MYAKLLAEAWREQNEKTEELAHAVAGTSMRHSMSGKCARQIHYYLTHEAVTNPFDLPGVWATGLGSRIHVWWQDALRAAYPDAEVEVTVSIPGADSSGHVDATVWEDGELTSLELKSINGFGFKKMAESGDGPRYSDMVQCCVNAYGLGAKKAVLLYLSLEAVSRSRAVRKGLEEHERIMKEFHFDEEQIKEVAETELVRWADIRTAGPNTPRSLPDPEYAPGTVVTDPATGKLELNGVVSGYAWQCGYCAYQLKCADDCKSGV